MVSFDDYFAREAEEVGKSRGLAAMAVIDVLQEQQNLAILPGLKVVDFFMVARLGERTGHIPRAFPIYSTEDPITLMGLTTFASQWIGVTAFQE